MEGEVRKNEADLKRATIAEEKARVEELERRARVQAAEEERRLRRESRKTSTSE